MTPAERDAAIRRGMLAAQEQLYKLDEEGAAALMRLYRWALGNIEQDIQSRADSQGSLALTQLADLRNQIDARLQRLEAARNNLLQEGLLRAGQIGSETFVNAGIEAAAMIRVPEEAVRFVRSFIAGDGLQLSDRVWRIDRGARDAIVNSVERSIISGHSATQSAREFLSQGLPVPKDVQDKVKSAGANGVAKMAAEIMVGDGQGGALYQSMRLFRTEINRAHGMAYMMQAKDVPGFKGIQFTLSPNHPKPDVCDEIANTDAFGLGKGIFPSMEEFVKVWPAHPNTFSFPIAVFD